MIVVAKRGSAQGSGVHRSGIAEPTDRSSGAGAHTLRCLISEQPIFSIKRLAAAREIGRHLYIK
ncbi:hypothetical protein [Rhizobium sp. LjRoot258]|uniref:hypothetical protein n=1 Tax=Rhizobium sp. LjRoot258 TaxID=3342299 RepID=UPI003ECD93F9